jgi:hypothetical protein
VAGLAVALAALVVSARALAKLRVSIQASDASPAVGQRVIFVVRSERAVDYDLRLIAVAPGQPVFRVVATITGDTGRPDPNVAAHGFEIRLHRVGPSRWRGLALLDALGDGERPVYATALLAGLRRGELWALRVLDVHGLDEETTECWISVERSWDSREGVVDPKSKAGVRLTLLCETLRTILAEHIRRTGRSGDDLIFGKTASEPFVPWTIAKHADDAWRDAELERVTLHQCRHGFDSFLDAAGVSEARADRYMGHAQNSVGDRYRHRLRGQLRDDAERLEEYLRGEVAEVVALPTGAQTGAQEAVAASLSGS